MKQVMAKNNLGTRQMGRQKVMELCGGEGIGEDETGKQRDRKLRVVDDEAMRGMDHHG